MDYRGEMAEFTSAEMRLAKLSAMFTVNVSTSLSKFLNLLTYHHFTE